MRDESSNFWANYVYANYEIGRKRDDHHPFLSRSMPEDFRVSELSTVHVNDRVIRISLEGIASITAVCNVLCLDPRHSRVDGEGVDRHDTVVLTREETAGVVDIYDRRSGVDKRGVVRWP